MDVETTRRIEAAALARHRPFELMERAGLAAARWARALCPHARRVWILAGPGNNGGDGLVAARWLHRAGCEVHVTHLAPENLKPADARHAWTEAHATGVQISNAFPPLDQWIPDLVLDALLGLGQNRPPGNAISACLTALATLPASTLILALDQPTGLCADTGRLLGDTAVRARHTLSFLTLKPGLFTGSGPAQAGQVWLAPLVEAAVPATGPTRATTPTARLTGRSDALAAWPERVPTQHKGSFGDVWVIGGARGMTGAATLAARAALSAGAGRVYLSLLHPAPHRGDAAAGDLPHDTFQPALMPRDIQAWRNTRILEHSTVVCGCGGGQEVATHLPHIMRHSARLILDADALNATATSPDLREQLRARADRNQVTIVTPHPLEAARLMNSCVARVQADRLAHARNLAADLRAVVVLKGSGTVIASPEGSCWVNPTGNARLGTAGSGDVLAGWMAGGWSQQPVQTGPHEPADPAPSWNAATRLAAAAVWWHGRSAEGTATDPVSKRLPLCAPDQITAMGRILLTEG